jgi:hypothetical protein
MKAVRNIVNQMRITMKSNNEEMRRKTSPVEQWIEEASPVNANTCQHDGQCREKLDDRRRPADFLQNQSAEKGRDDSQVRLVSCQL